MSHFEEKIKQQKQDEQEMLRESFISLEAAILSDNSSENIKDELAATQKAVDSVLKYFDKKTKKIPSYIDGFDARLEYAMRPYGIMSRSVKLSEKWFRDSFMPIIAFTKKDNRPVALIPNKIKGYTYHDYVSGAKVHLNKFTTTMFCEEALCFYRPLPNKNTGKRSLLLYLKNCIPASDYIRAAIATAAVSLLGLLLPRITYMIVGKIVDDKNTALLIIISVFLLCVLLTSQILSIVKELILSRIKTKIGVQLEAAIMARLILLPVKFFRKYTSGDLYSRISKTAFFCESFIENGFAVVISTILSFLLLFQINSILPELFVPAVLVILVVVALGVIAAFRQVEVSRKRIDCEAKQTGIEYSLMSGVQKLKTTGTEKRVFAKWADIYSQSAKETYNPPLYLKIYSALAIIIPLFGTVLFYIIAEAANDVKPGAFIAFSAAFAMLLTAVNSFSKAMVSFAETLPILEMIKPILAETPENSEEKETIVNLRGEIDINSVSFGYDSASTRIIEDFSLHINEGEYVAVVGKSGSGKSTLLRLLLGFEKPEKGSILYDGKDLSRLDLKSLRRSIGTVLQNDSLVFGDIYTNITFHSPWLTIDDAWRAAEIAGIADDIRGMTMGMRTIIDDNQGSLSGGQKQRILIARAIVLSPNILFFDEATSALDNITQKQVSVSLDALNCTRVVIAHRLSTVQNCDRILVLDNGKIVEQGSYKELIELNGEFAELVRRQRIDETV